MGRRESPGAARAIAALCEPRLLRNPDDVRRVLGVLDRTTASLAAALPEEGRTALDRWLAVDDHDVRWVMRENLGKSRLRALGPEWVAERRARLDRPAPG